MHELGRYIQSLMDLEGMTRPELERRSGLKRQHVHGLLTGESLSRLPATDTFEGLRRAFPHVPLSRFVLAAAASAGLSVGELGTPDYGDLSNDALLGILKRRLDGGESGDPGIPKKKDDGSSGPSLTVVDPGEDPDEWLDTAARITSPDSPK